MLNLLWAAIAGSTPDGGTCISGVISSTDGAPAPSARLEWAPFVDVSAMATALLDAAGAVNDDERDAHLARFRSFAQAQTGQKQIPVDDAGHFAFRSPRPGGVLSASAPDGGLVTWLYGPSRAFEPARLKLKEPFRESLVLDGPAHVITFNPGTGRFAEATFPDGGSFALPPSTDWQTTFIWAPGHSSRLIDWHTALPQEPVRLTPTRPLEVTVLLDGGLCDARVSARISTASKSADAPAVATVNGRVTLLERDVHAVRAEAPGLVGSSKVRGAAVTISLEPAAELEVLVPEVASGLKWAEVSLSSPGHFERVHGPLGQSLRLRAVPVGRYSLAVRAYSGCNNRSSQQPWQRLELTLKPGLQKRVVSFERTPVLVVRFRDTAGQPVKDAWMSVDPPPVLVKPLAESATEQACEEVVLKGPGRFVVSAHDGRAGDARQRVQVPGPPLELVLAPKRLLQVDLVLPELTRCLVITAGGETRMCVDPSEALEFALLPAGPIELTVAPLGEAPLVRRKVTMPARGVVHETIDLTQALPSPCEVR